MLVAAAGAIAATGASVSPAAFSPDNPLVADAGARATGGVGGGSGLEPYRPQLVDARAIDTGQVGRLARGRQVAAELEIKRVTAEREAAERARQVAAREAADRAAREAADRAARAAAADRAAREAAARQPRFVAPAAGRLTSVYGMRWGTMHWGIDIANRIGTPILSAADGVVVESGPASGFGLWVRVRHADGTVTVYGHIDRSLVRRGQAVRAGQQIATMGNRGDSTGPHLHFEVWLGNGSKTNPLTWLRARGVRI